ncbi:MAG: ATP-binding cassette subfamily F protein 3 [Parasphingorhabdus sp.]|jgi:ATP-binding cassette subfamily F protein 3
MLQFSDLAIRRGTRQLFSNATLTIPSGRKVGIIGANGCGKSSLFQLILKEIEADEGGVTLTGDPVIAHVAQQAEMDERDAVQHVLDGDAELRGILHALSQPDANVAALQTRMEDIDGYSAEARAAKLLSGLGFTQERLTQSANTLSGGWQMRISLARALMCRSDLLLLDEPTNHLDLDAVIWLEEWLRRYSGTLLLISHDREFLDRTINQILAYESNTLVLSTGNYSDYERRRAERLSQQGAAYDKQQREISHMLSYINRFRAQATKARQAQSRLKALERLTEIAPAHIDRQFHFQFREPKHLPEPLLRLDNVSAGYDDLLILNGVRMSLVPGDRIGLLGLNGAGKTTLSRVLAGDLSIAGGERKPAKHLKAGYFAQHQMQLLQPAQSPADHFSARYDLHDEQKLRDFLGGFGFAGDRVFEPVAPFSGGEKARLVLSMVVYESPNLLIMDEPTNHLDLDMRLALTMALQEFAGAMVLVSHDRHLLRTTTTELLLVDDGVVKPFDGSLDDYPRWLADRRNNKSNNNNQPANQNKRAQRQLDANLRRQLKPLFDKVKKLEQSIEKLQKKDAEIDLKLADPDLYDKSRSDEITKLSKQKADIRRECDEAEELWLEAMESLEEAKLAE